MKIIKKAYAKINLSLKVINKREDGFHNLDMIMSLVGIYDTLTFEKTTENINIHCENSNLKNDESNIIYKTIQLMFKKYNINAGIKVDVKKEIPIAAGLGGGSSCAAATIKAVNEIFNLNLSEKEMINLGLEIGSDVPFFIKGKIARARGRGEILDPISFKCDYSVVIVNPNFEVSTKDIFNSHVINNSNQNIDRVLKQKNNKQFYKLLFNDLEKTAISKYKEIQNIKNNLNDMGAISVLMSGSGATVFGFFQDKIKAQSVVKKLPKNYYKKITHLIT